MRRTPSAAPSSGDMAADSAPPCGMGQPVEVDGPADAKDLGREQTRGGGIAVAGPGPVPRRAAGVLVVEQREGGGHITTGVCRGEDATYVSRIREDTTVEHGLSLCVVSDNLRKGAALNAVQIAEHLVENYL